MTIKFVDSAPMEGLRRTSDGYLAGSFRCARPGVQTYLRKELQLDGDPNGLVRVYRPPEVVFDEDSLKTYAGRPITIEHPKVAVCADNWKELAVGTVGQKVLRDGDVVVVEGVIMDSAAISDIESGKRQVSMGYQTPMALQDGVTPQGEPYDAVQVGPIRINHLAVVDRARGGSDLRFGDAAPQLPWGAHPVNDSFGANNMTLKLVVLGDSAVNLPLADAMAVEAFKAMTLKQVADAEAEVIETKKKAKASEDEKDEEIGRLKAEKKTLADAAITPEKVAGLVAARLALEKNARIVDSAIVMDGLSDDEVKRAAVVAHLGEQALVDATPAEINGMFRGLVAVRSTSPNDSVREALRETRPTDSANELWGDSTFKAAGVNTKKGA